MGEEGILEEDCGRHQQCLARARSCRGRWPGTERRAGPAGRLGPEL